MGAKAVVPPHRPHRGLFLETVLFTLLEICPGGMHPDCPSLARVYTRALVTFFYWHFLFASDGPVVIMLWHN